MPRQQRDWGRERQILTETERQVFSAFPRFGHRALVAGAGFEVGPESLACGLSERQRRGHRQRQCQSEKRGTGMGCGMRGRASCWRRSLSEPTRSAGPVRGLSSLPRTPEFNRRCGSSSGALFVHSCRLGQFARLQEPDDEARGERHRGQTSSEEIVCRRGIGEERLRYLVVRGGRTTTSRWRRARRKGGCELFEHLSNKDRRTMGRQTTHNRSMRSAQATRERTQCCRCVCVCVCQCEHSLSITQ